MLVHGVDSVFVFVEVIGSTVFSFSLPSFEIKCRKLAMINNVFMSGKFLVSLKIWAALSSQSQDMNTVIVESTVSILLKLKHEF